MSEILLSIIIPTKDRYPTLNKVVPIILNNFPENIEIIISDNSEDKSNDIEFLKNDIRVKYFYNKEPISIVENTNIALDNCNGDFVCFIGDDDLVLPVAMQVINKIKELNYDGVIFPGAYYWWENVIFSKEDYYNQPGALWLPSIRNTSSYRNINTKKALYDLLNGGGVAIGDLPKLYHGIVRRETLLEIKNKFGAYILGASPDIAIATTLGLIGANVVRVEFPLTVYGASKNSGGGWTAENKHHGNIHSQTHIPQNTKDNWSEKLPPIWSEHTIYPQTVLEVYDRFCLECELNFSAFYASMYVNEPHLRSYLYPYIKRHFSENPLDFFIFSKFIFKKFLGRNLRFFKKKIKKNGMKVYHNQSLHDVLQMLNIKDVL